MTSQACFLFFLFLEDNMQANMMDSTESWCQSRWAYFLAPRDTIASLALSTRRESKSTLSTFNRARVGRNQGVEQVWKQAIWCLEGPLE